MNDEKQPLWLDVGPLTDIPLRGARTLQIGDGENIAIFRSASNQVFALVDRCPHRHGPLSQGVVHGDTVTCPLHGWVICLRSGSATGQDEGQTAAIDARIDAGRVLLDRSAVMNALKRPDVANCE